MAGKAARTEAARELSIAEAQSDVRVGGRYRVVMGHESGREFRLRGEYRELTPPSRDGHRGGWDSAFGVLDDLLATLH